MSSSLSCSREEGPTRSRRARILDSRRDQRTNQQLAACPADLRQPAASQLLPPALQPTSLAEVERGKPGNEVPDAVAAKIWQTEAACEAAGRAARVGVLPPNLRAMDAVVRGLLDGAKAFQRFGARDGGPEEAVRHNGLLFEYWPLCFHLSAGQLPASLQSESASARV